MSEQKVYFRGGKSRVAKVTLISGAEIFVDLTKVSAIATERPVNYAGPCCQVGVIVDGESVCMFVTPGVYRNFVSAWLYANAENLPDEAWEAK